MSVGTWQRVLVLGAGKVGATIADMLAQRHGVRVTLVDAREVGPAKDDPLVTRKVADIAKDNELEAALFGHGVVINALPFYFAERVARHAARAGLAYFDLTEDVAATRAIRELAATSTSPLMPQCGLAPGVIGMLGGHLARSFDELYDLRLRVGALTRQATNALRYSFTWSIDGLINEYCNPCDAIVGGRCVQLQALEGHETLSIEGGDYEAFNTSGGLGTLCESLEGRVRNLDYKSIRYRGHQQAMSLLVHDLRLGERRPLLREVLEGGVPHSRDDVVVMLATATGLREGRYEQESRSARIVGAPLRGVQRTAIELTTAAGVVGAYELMRAGKLPATGFVRQEQVSLDDFLATSVGVYYAALAGVPALAAARVAEPVHT